jgi:LmbE family N-acetylglucosaminyl deacetylase
MQSNGSIARVWNAICDPQNGLAVGGKTLDIRPLILIAHPDDETISASVAMMRMRDPVVVFVTDGAPRDRHLWSPDATGSREEYSRMRMQEAASALAIAGIPSERIFCLGAIDQEAIEEVPVLVDRFVSLLQKIQPGVIITHAYEGGHPDHDAAALIARITAGSESLEKQPEILEMSSYHLRNGNCVTGEFLPDTGEEVLTLWPLPEERERKQRMAATHHSQRFVLEGFRMEPELLRPAPAYDFTQPPHVGKLWYECLDWPMSGERWRQLATSALTQFQQNA